MSTREPATPDTHCEFCGAEYETGSKGSPAAERVTTSSSENEGPAGEPVAHCEFCGAEYEAPEGRQG